MLADGALLRFEHTFFRLFFRRDSWIDIFNHLRYHFFWECLIEKSQIQLLQLQSPEW